MYVTYVSAHMHICTWLSAKYSTCKLGLWGWHPKHVHTYLDDMALGPILLAGPCSSLLCCPSVRVWFNPSSSFKDTRHMGHTWSCCNHECRHALWSRRRRRKMTAHCYVKHSHTQIHTRTLHMYVCAHTWCRRVSYCCYVELITDSKLINKTQLLIILTS